MADPYKDKVVLYLPFEGSRHGDTVILDKTGKTVTCNGNTILSTAVAPPFGTTSAYFDGNGDYLSVASAAAACNPNGTITIEFWLYVATIPASPQTILCIDGSGGTNFGHGVWIGSSGAISFNIAKDSNPVDSLWLDSGASSISAATWQHVAIVKRGLSCSLYVNGSLKNSGVFSEEAEPNASGTTVQVGQYYDGNASYRLLGYIKDLRITKGVARYTGNFSVSQTTTVDDADWANVVLAVHGEGTGTTFTDVSNSAAAITTNGNTTHSTAVAPPFGTSSIYFNGSGDYLSLASGLLNTSSDFTVEGWFRFTDLAGSVTLFSQYNSADSARTIFDVRSSLLTIFNGAGGIVSGTTTLQTGQWYHIAYVRQGSTVKAYVNGALEVTHSAFSAPPDRAFWVGSYSLSAGADDFAGYIKDIRVTVGAARYTQNFNPWRVVDPYYKDSVLLISGEGSGTTFIDTSPIAKSITTSGNTVHSTTVAPPFGSSSIYLDGASDYLTIANSDDYSFGTGDFTIECWVNSQTTSGTYVGAIANTGTGATGQYHWRLGVRAGSANNVGFTFQHSTAWVDIYPSSAVNVNDSQWHHLAVVRRSGTFTVFVDGVARASTYSAEPVGTTGRGCYVGYNAADTTYYTGYIKDIRIIKGVAKYTSDFTPAKVPALTKSNGCPTTFPDKTTIKTIAKPLDWDSTEPPRIFI